MKSVGIVICNYNKREYVVNCIQSIIASDFSDYDIYVVDNASEDDSVEQLRLQFGSRIEIIQNKENLGGSGGFNVGIQRIIEAGYPYLMCVDNDIVMDRKNIGKLYGFLAQHEDIGMAGSKICRMQQKDRLQELGADIDFDKCMVQPHYKNYLDNEELPEIQYCDYVPACSLMVRTEIIRRIGGLPEENFIYWDDMEWGYRIKQAGYKVAAYREAKVYHAMGTNSGETYFSTYYFWRNRIRFFLKYTPDDKKRHMYEVLLTNLFQTLYGCHYKGKNNQIKVMMYAFDDAVHGILGKADKRKILDKDKIEDRIGRIVQDCADVLVEFNGDYKFLLKLLGQIGPQCSVTVQYADTEAVKSQHLQCRVVQHVDNTEQFGCHLVMCEHITRITDRSLKKIYIDSFSNVLENEKDIMHFNNYEYTRELFVKSYQSLMEMAAQ